MLKKLPNLGEENEKFSGSLTIDNIPDKKSGKGSRLHTDKLTLVYRFLKGKLDQHLKIHFNLNIVL